LARGRDKAVHRHSLIRFRIFCKKLLAVVMLDLFFVRGALVPANTRPRHTSSAPRTRSAYGGRSGWGVRVDGQAKPGHTGNPESRIRAKLPADPAPANLPVGSDYL
jgi:hypothetical protein